MQDVLFNKLVLASAANSRAAMCEQASPSPAIQLQCAHTIVPTISAATHGLRGGAEGCCEYVQSTLSIAVCALSEILQTKTVLTQPST